MHWHMNVVPDRDFNKNGICIDPTQWTFAHLYGTPPGACNGTTLPACTSIAPDAEFDWDCNAETTNDIFPTQELWGCADLTPAAKQKLNRPDVEALRSMKAGIGFVRDAK
jgi:hypothetical protein